MKKEAPVFGGEEAEGFFDAEDELSASESGSEPESEEPGGVGAIFAEYSQR